MLPGMLVRVAFVVAIGAIACRPSSRVTTPVVGTESDDGHGELARASSALRIGDEPSIGFTNTPARWYGSLGSDDDMIDAADGSDGAITEDLSVPAQQLHFHHHLHGSRRIVQSGLPGAIEGTIAWAAPPPRGPCSGPRTALVFIDSYTAGRSPPPYGRSNPGVIAKRGCALMPVAQLVPSSPAVVTIHGDAAHASVQVTAPDASHASYAIEEAGVVQVELQPGVTRVDGDGLAPAWIVAVDTPYYTMTDDAGRFRLDELEPGTYDITIWAPPATAAGAPVVAHRNIRVDGKSPTQVRVTLGR